MTPSADEWNKWIDKRINAILDRPLMWGQREAQELQLLQLVEIRKLVIDSEPLIKNPRLIVNRWIEFGKKHKCGNGPLWALKCSDKKFNKLLRELVDDLKNA